MNTRFVYVFNSGSGSGSRFSISSLIAGKIGRWPASNVDGGDDGRAC